MMTFRRKAAPMTRWMRQLLTNPPDAYLPSAPWRRATIRCCLAIAGLSLAACQATSTEDLLSVAPDLPIPAQETIGAGPTMIALLLPRSGPEPGASRSRDFFDGAKLAATELGDGQLRVTVYDTAGRPENTADLAGQAIAAGARLIVAPPDPDGLARIAAINPVARPPVIALSERGGSAGIFAFASDSVDSAIDGARAAVAAGQTRVLVVEPEGFPAEDHDRFARGIARNGGKLVGRVYYPPADAQIGPALKAAQPLFGKADTVVIFGSGRAPAVVAQSIAAQGLGGTITALVGNSGWPQELYTVPVLDGALVPMPDQESLKHIAGRYQSAAGRPLSYDAAFAFDAVAIAAGLVRQRGPAALTTSALLTDAGFRGATGLFRFRKDGSVERRHVIYRIEKGRLVLLQGDAGGF